MTFLTVNCGVLVCCGFLLGCANKTDQHEGITTTHKEVSKPPEAENPRSDKPGTSPPAVRRLPDPAKSLRSIWLQQGWDESTRKHFNYTSQGSSTFSISYEWFTVLEQPSSTPDHISPPFIEASYLSRFGFIVSQNDNDNDNPDNLPVGFSRDAEFKNPLPSPLDVNPANGKPYAALGFTCAGCHTGQLEYGNTRLLIQGGAAMTDLGLLRDQLKVAMFSLVMEGIPSMSPEQFGANAGAALRQLDKKGSKPSARLQRFVTSILETSPHLPPSPAQRQGVVAQVAGFLGAALVSGLAEKKAAAARVAEHQPVIEEGFTRLDALARIGNQIFWSLQRRANGVTDTSLDSNYALTNAPVNFPPIWDSPWFDWVQYNGSIMQPMFRNFSESLGVGAIVNLSPDGARQLHSTVKVKNLLALETELAGPPPFKKQAFEGLQSPKWPQAILGKVRPALVQQGKKLYSQRCQRCHLPPVDDAKFWSEEFWRFDEFADSGKGRHRYLKLALVALEEIGTDPAQASNMRNRRIELPKALGGKQVGFGAALKSLEAAIEQAYKNIQASPGEQNKLNGYRPNLLRAELAYRPRPLNGIWATPPFLHNGAVPSLYALLSPVAERPKEFYLGSRSFDPKTIGFEHKNAGNGFFKLDTSLPGNRNTGHEFADRKGKGVIGPKLKKDERMALIEYVKTL